MVVVSVTVYLNFTFPSAAVAPPNGCPPSPTNGVASFIDGVGLLVDGLLILLHMLVRTALIPRLFPFHILFCAKHHMICHYDKGFVADGEIFSVCVVL